MESEDIVLDQKDQLILSELDFHAREGLTELAQRIGISKQLLEYRLKALERKGILSGYYPVINTFRLGYQYGRILVQLNSRTPEIDQKLRSYVQKTPHVFWAYSLSGSFDYLLVFWARDIIHFREIIADFLVQFGRYIRHRSENLITNVVHLSVGIFNPKSPRHLFELKPASELFILDTIDRKLLKALTHNSRASYVELAQETNINHKVIRYRLKRLEQRQIIAGYRPVINYDRAGILYIKIFFQLDFSNTEKNSELETFLRKQPEVLYLVYGIGLPGDLDIEILTHSQTEFFKFIDQVRQRFGKLIVNYQYWIYSQLLKVNYFPFSEPDKKSPKQSRGNKPKEKLSPAGAKD